MKVSKLLIVDRKKIVISGASSLFLLISSDIKKDKKSVFKNPYTSAGKNK